MDFMLQFLSMNSTASQSSNLWVDGRLAVHAPKLATVRYNSFSKNGATKEDVVDAQRAQ